MGRYAERVLPRITNIACGAKSVDPLRRRACQGRGVAVPSVVVDGEFPAAGGRAPQQCGALPGCAGDTTQPLTAHAGRGLVDL